MAQGLVGLLVTTQVVYIERFGEVAEWPNAAVC
jgi:hypothetical protein